MPSCSYFDPLILRTKSPSCSERQEVPSTSVHSRRSFPSVVSFAIEGASRDWKSRARVPSATSEVGDRKSLPSVLATNEASCCRCCDNYPVAPSRPSHKVAVEAGTNPNPSCRKNCHALVDCVDTVSEVFGNVWCQCHLATSLTYR